MANAVGSRDAFVLHSKADPLSSFQCKHFNDHTHPLMSHNEFHDEECAHGIYAHFGQSHESFWTILAEARQ